MERPNRPLMNRVTNQTRSTLGYPLITVAGACFLIDDDDPIPPSRASSLSACVPQAAGKTANDIQDVVTSLYLPALKAQDKVLGFIGSNTQGLGGCPFAGKSAGTLSSCFAARLRTGVVGEPRLLNHGTKRDWQQRN